MCRNRRYAEENSFGTAPNGTRSVAATLDTSWAAAHFANSIRHSISRAISDVRRTSAPWDAGAMFDREAPLEVEAGCGKGLFLAGAAAAHPEHNFLGIELAARYARFAAGRLAKRRSGQCADGARRRAASLRRATARQLPDGRACLFSRSVVEGEAQEAPRAH